jgi:hypothetical protein
VRDGSCAAHACARRGDGAVREVSCAGGRISNLEGFFFVGRKMAGCYPPTLEEASVRELSVLDLPALGFPTRPIRGSRGILKQFNLEFDYARQMWKEGRIESLSYMLGARVFG